MLPPQWWAAGGRTSSPRVGWGTVEAAGGASAAATSRSREAARGSGWVGVAGAAGG